MRGEISLSAEEAEKILIEHIRKQIGISFRIPIVMTVDGLVLSQSHELVTFKFGDLQPQVANEDVSFAIIANISDDNQGIENG